MSATNSNDFSFTTFLYETVPNGATFLGEFAKQVRLGAIADGQIMDKLAGGIRGQATY